MRDGLTPCLWFDSDAEEAARFYAGLFPDSRLDEVVHAPADYPGGGRSGDVLEVGFTLDGRPFRALNGGPAFAFTEAVSLVVPCDTQAEIDRYWRTLSAHPEAEQCGWVKDRYGLSWQIVPSVLPRFLADPDRKRAGRVMQAMLTMKKIDIAALERAAQTEG